jgi:uncharacterized glyoxalase superfamily protein PhnB
MAVAVMGIAAGLHGQTKIEGGKTMDATKTEQAKASQATGEVKKITPVLFVKEIEPVLPFWVERLGFTKTIEVPDGEKLAFVSLVKGSTEVMYQTYASVDKLDPAMSEAARKGPTFLYIEVGDLDAVLAALKGVALVKPVNTTFYGMREFIVQDPGGHYVTFAQPTAK